MKKILFFINGLGLGNSTRCHAIIQKLLNHNVKIGAVLSYNSKWYFEQNKISVETFYIDQMSYQISKNGELQVTKTLLNSFNNYQIFKNNKKIIENSILSFKPDIIVSDSVYIFNLPRKYNIPYISINNSCLTMCDFKRKSTPNSIKAHYYFIEKLDFLYHTKYPDLSISCGITQKENLDFKNFQQTFPIYREGLKEKKTLKKKCLVMFSGSSNSKNSINLSFIKDEIIPINFEQDKRKNNLISKKIYNNIDLINDVDYCIINSGYSAIAESVMMNKPVLSIPIPNHAEQWCNAKKIEDEKIGMLSTLNNLESTYSEFIKNYDMYNDNLKLKKNDTNGADQITDIILKF